MGCLQDGCGGVQDADQTLVQTVDGKSRPQPVSTMEFNTVLGPLPPTLLSPEPWIWYLIDIWIYVDQDPSQLKVHSVLSCDCQWWSGRMGFCLEDVCECYCGIWIVQTQGSHGLRQISLDFEQVHMHQINSIHPINSIHLISYFFDKYFDFFFFFWAC